jgi:hypothetical protein
METQNENVYVNPDVDSHILSATAKEVILRGCTFEKDSPEAEPQPYVLKITRETYFAAMTEWLDGKAEYADLTGEYCGQGVIVFEATLAEKQSAWLTIDGNRTSVATHSADPHSFIN